MKLKSDKCFHILNKTDEIVFKHNRMINKLYETACHKTTCVQLINYDFMNNIDFRNYNIIYVQELSSGLIYSPSSAKPAFHKYMNIHKSCRNIELCSNNKRTDTLWRETNSCTILPELGIYHVHLWSYQDPPAYLQMCRSFVVWGKQLIINKKNDFIDTSIKKQL